MDLWGALADITSQEWFWPALAVILGLPVVLLVLGEVQTAMIRQGTPGARIVKAFNHVQPQLVAGDPGRDGGRRVLFYSGDDAEAKAQVGTLIDRLDFFGWGSSSSNLARWRRPGRTGSLPAWRSRGLRWSPVVLGR